MSRPLQRTGKSGCHGEQCRFKKGLRCLTALALAGNIRTETLRAFDAREFAAAVKKRGAKVRHAASLTQ